MKIPFISKAPTMGNRLPRVVYLVNPNNRNGMKLKVNKESDVSLGCQKDADKVRHAFYKQGPSYLIGNELVHFAVEGSQVIVDLVAKQQVVDLSMIECVETLLGKEWDNLPNNMRDLIKNSKMGVTVSLPQPIPIPDLPPNEMLHSEQNTEAHSTFSEDGKKKPNSWSLLVQGMLIGAGVMYVMLNQGWIFSL